MMSIISSGVSARKPGRGVADDGPHDANLKPLERRRLLKVAAAGRKLLSAALPAWRATHEAIEPRLQGPDRLRADLRALVI